MTPQSGKQTITIHIIQRNKGTQTMEVGKLIECNAKWFFFFKNNAQNKGVALHFSFNKSRLGHTINRTE